jgi:DNA-binding NtrC family response regulator
MNQIRVLPLDHSILVVEDNWIIALDAEQILVDAGNYRVKIAHNVTKAMEFIATGLCGLAVLDINLGHETSLVIADELQLRGIPYFFASGYKDANTLPDRFKGAQMIAKPYTATTLLAAVHQAVAT